jgi:hypothetical protein
LLALVACDALRGPAGASAYDIWLAQGHTGTQADFLEWLRGADGRPGADGAPGAPGQSAYEMWRAQGNVGTEAEYVAWQQAPITDHFGGQGTASGGGSEFCYLGAIKLTASYVGEGLPAEGQVLPIAQNPALYALLGTTYGGDGVTTFALPDLRPVAPRAANGALLTYTICDQGRFPSRY